MDNLNFENILRRAGDFKLDISEKTDINIINMIREYEPVHSTFFNALFYRVAFSILIFVLFIGAGFKVKETIDINNQKKLYNYIISEIINVNNQKDLDGAINLYSNEFFLTHNKDEMKRNIYKFFNTYNDIAYTPKMEKIVVKDDKVMIKNKFTYIARNNKNTIQYSGEERIYLKKENNKWKIIAWIYEK